MTLLKDIQLCVVYIFKIYSKLLIQQVLTHILFIDSPMIMNIQENLDMMDSVGPGKLVCYMQNPSYAYDRLSLTDASVYIIVLGTSFDIYKSQNSERICLAGLLLYMYLSAEKYQTVRTECRLAERNSAHVLVSAGIRRQLDTCLSSIHNAYYIVNSNVCAVILVCGSRVSAYRIQPMHGPIHILDMHGTGTKYIVRHS